MLQIKLHPSPVLYRFMSNKYYTDLYEASTVYICKRVCVLKWYLVYLDQDDPDRKGGCF